MKTQVEKLNFSVDITQLRDYYTVLQKEYSDYIWSVKGLAEKDEYTATRVADSLPNYGWAITTEVMDETSKSNPPWPEVISEFSYAEKNLKPERKTPLAFGIAEKILQTIPYAHHMIMSVFPPTGATIPHTDQDFLLRVHVPLYTNKNVKWLTDSGYHTMDAVGQAYICDTRKMHAAYNDSNENRVHFIFAIEDKYLEDIKKITGIIKL
jgi:hypothetical protein